MHIKQNSTWLLQNESRIGWLGLWFGLLSPLCRVIPKCPGLISSCHANWHKLPNLTMIINQLQQLSTVSSFITLRGKLRAWTPPKGHWLHQKDIDSSKRTLTSPKGYWLLQKNIDSSKQTLTPPKEHWLLKKNIDSTKRTLTPPKRHWLYQKNIDSSKRTWAPPRGHWLHLKGMVSSKRTWTPPKDHWLLQKDIDYT